MTRHLSTCGAPGPEKEPPNQSFHLFVEARHNKMYWMHLGVPLDAPLARVDAFLRDIWLECCGHMSAFTIEGRQYLSAGARELGESGMGVRTGRVLYPGMVFTYEYDFGSTTELKLKVLALRELETNRGKVKPLARNDEPEVACEQCGNHTATQICQECDCKGQGWLCEACAEGHDCDPELLLPVVNSPRAGVCGYCG